MGMRQEAPATPGSGGGGGGGVRICIQSTSPG